MIYHFLFHSLYWSEYWIIFFTLKNHCYCYFMIPKKKKIIHVSFHADIPVTHGNINSLLLYFLTSLLIRQSCIFLGNSISCLVFFSIIFTSPSAHYSTVNMYVHFFFRNRLIPYVSSYKFKSPNKVSISSMSSFFF